MIILGIETSCDETAASVVKNGSLVLSNVVASSLPYHSQTGGIIPEVAAREQSRSIIPVIESAIKEASSRSWEISNSNALDALAVTFGPGLIGPLLVGVETVKTLSYVWGKKVVPVNHLLGHLYSAWLETSKPPTFPLIALIVSGGHTELIFVKNHGNYKYLGGTRDDSAGEAFDKIARLLNLGYPGGPAIENAAKSGSPSRFDLPRPMINSQDFDFSFSGLKTAVVTKVGSFSEKIRGEKQFVYDMAASVQEAIVDTLVYKTQKAANNYSSDTIVIGGGVAANKRLRTKLRVGFNGQIVASAPNYSVDNGAMIAAAAFFNYKPLAWRKIRADTSILF